MIHCCGNFPFRYQVRGASSLMQRMRQRFVFHERNKGCVCMLRSSCFPWVPSVEPSLGGKPEYVSGFSAVAHKVLSSSSFHRWIFTPSCLQPYFNGQCSSTLAILKCDLIDLVFIFYLTTQTNNLLHEYYSVVNISLENFKVMHSSTPLFTPCPGWLAGSFYPLSHSC